MYRVRLRFVEPEDGPGARVFSVTANGAPAIVDLDVAAAAGGPLKALERSFVATVANGALNLDFAGSSGDAIVSSIDVEPAATQGQ
jgi:beta-galactosidase